MSKLFNPINHDLKTTLWCGPGALAIMSGQPTSVIREVLRKVSGRQTIKGVYHSEMERAAEKLGYRLERVSAVTSAARRTFAAWEKANRELFADTLHLLNVGNHYVTVAGRQFCDNWTKTPVPLKKAPKRRRRVKAVWRIVKVAEIPPDALPKVPEPKKDTEAKPRREAKALAALHGIVIEPHVNPGEYWVWPPDGQYDGETRTDPFGDDHCVFDGWAEILKRVQRYANDRVTGESPSPEIVNPQLASETAVS